MSKEEEFTRSVGLGLFDYLRKSRSRGFVVSLSGGADSAAVSCLVNLSIKLAVAALGEDGVREKLGSWLRGDASTWNRQILTCVYQATGNSSDTTRAAARALAEALGADFHLWNVGELVESYTKLAAAAAGRELTCSDPELPRVV